VLVGLCEWGNLLVSARFFCWIYEISERGVIVSSINVVVGFCWHGGCIWRQSGHYRIVHDGVLLLLFLLLLYHRHILANRTGQKLVDEHLLVALLVCQVLNRLL